MPLYLTIILLIFFLSLSAFFSSSETALFSLSKMYRKKLEKEKKLTKKAISRLLERPKTTLITILLGNTVVNVIFASLATLIALEIPGISHSLAILIEIVLATIVILIFGEIFPKFIAFRYSKKYSALISIPLTIFYYVSFPIVKLIEYFTKIITPKTHHQITDDNTITSEDIKSIVEETAPDLINIKKNERQMIRSIFDFTDTTVKEIMTPRIDIAAVEISNGIQELKKVIIDSGYSRIPVYRGNIDNIIGMVYSKDIILNREANDKIKKLMRNCFYVPENMQINLLLSYFRKNQIHLAIVVDEYGGTSGIITMEDILEEIVGEILDESDKEAVKIKKVAKNEFLLDCSVDLDDVIERFDLPVSDSVDSFSGFLYQLFGRIPAEEESLVYENKYKFIVQELEEQRIKTVRLKILA